MPALPEHDEEFLKTVQATMVSWYAHGKVTFTEPDGTVVVVTEEGDDEG